MDALLNLTFGGSFFFVQRRLQEAKKDPEEYVGFFREYGQFLKEGVCTHFDYRDELAKVCTCPHSCTKEFDDVARCCV